MKKKTRWVIKAGSQMVVQGGPLLLRHWMEQVLKLQEQNIEVIWVTSGAIALAKQKTHFNKNQRTLPEKQALSAIGQPVVMDHYLLALQANSLKGAQVLLTNEDIRLKDRKNNLKNTFEQLLKWKYVPVLNENDAVSTAEIQFGDNDSLASQVAVMMKAQKLILLTDVDGLYDKNPKKNKDAKLIPFVKKLTQSQVLAAKDSGKSVHGTGGMYSKLLAAQFAQKANIQTHLVRGDWPNNLVLLSEGQAIGTQIGGPL
jgi:glutamate 5-kinase